jgi:hypothetical protein
MVSSVEFGANETIYDSPLELSAKGIAEYE